MKDINWSANSTLCIVCIHAHAYLCAKCKSEICINLEIKLYLFWNLCSLNNIIEFSWNSNVQLSSLETTYNHVSQSEVNLLQVAPNLNTFKILLYAYSYLHNTFLLYLLYPQQKKSRHGLNRLGSYLEETLKFFFHDFIR